MAESNQAANSSAVAVPKSQPFSFWRLLQTIWFQVLKPLATGVVFGAGSMLGMCLVRFYVMEPLGIVHYKEFQRPPLAIKSSP